ncbi:hypothetical protein RclHR1_25490001 [Rhizophagus clarus]|uniref:Uncharacterized protein n=1 Tax=Rhizophagus clarus TaxID=94130 RepID=A0A2Z6RU42_9GLOM|nr:hypothetical protein RclHR1_25490001 [Rhizophagus clarus]GES75410.1 hypothetical protein RCL_jg8953.t1 [Rhizophagus clarus]
MDSNFNFTKHSIWIPYCQALNIWEDYLGITQKAKQRSYSKDPYPYHHGIDLYNREDETVSHLGVDASGRGDT